jgi:hypothetical protein
MEQQDKRSIHQEGRRGYVTHIIVRKDGLIKFLKLVGVKVVLRQPWRRGIRTVFYSGRGRGGGIAKLGWY